MLPAFENARTRQPKPARKNVRAHTHLRTFPTSPDLTTMYARKRLTAVERAREREKETEQRERILCVDHVCDVKHSIHYYRTALADRRRGARVERE